MARARLLVRESRALKADVDLSGLSGHVRLGAISTALTDFMPKIVKHISTKAPDAELTIVPGSSAGLYDMLIKQELDAAIVVKPTFHLPKQIQASAIIRQRLVLISSDRSNLSPQKTLKQTPLIVYDKASWGGRIAWEWIKKQQIDITVLCEVDSPEMIAILVEQGLGIAVLPEWTGLMERHSDLIVTPISSHPKYQREIWFLSHQMTAARKLVTLAQAAINPRSSNTTG